MSKVVYLSSTLDICCPHCNEYNEIYDIAISVTIDNTDIARHKDECVFEYKCEYCYNKFEVRPQMHIDVIAL